MFEGSVPHDLLLTTKQMAKLCNAFRNNLASNIKLSKAQIFKFNQSESFLGALLSKLAGPIMEIAF